MSTRRRKASFNKIEENVFKLMSNSASGKTIETKRKRYVVDSFRTRTTLLAQTNKIWMKTYKKFNSNLAAVTSTSDNPLKNNWNKPTLVGATKKDLSKQSYGFSSTLNI